MKNMDIRISVKTVWALIIISSALSVIAPLAKIMHQEFSQVMLAAGIVLVLSTWTIVLTDMLMHSIPDKKAWLFFMFIAPGITPIVYLTRRKTLIG